MAQAHFQSINPYTQTIIAEYPIQDKHALDKKISQAELTYKSWRKSTFAQRSELLLKVAEILKRDTEKYARIITDEMGKHIREARAEVLKCATACSYYAQEAETLLADQLVNTPFKSKVVFDSIGCVFTIMPWNFPFWQVFRQATASLSAGNVLMLKHAPNVSGCSLAMESIFLEAGFPEGAFQSLIMSVEDIEYVVQHPIVQAITLTGSERAGVSVGALAGKHIKKSVLELGGSDPVLVLDDADLNKAAQIAVQSRMQNAGQSCIAAKRFLVTPKTAELFTGKVYDLIQNIKQGNPLDDSIQMGPMARLDLAEGLEKQLKDSMESGAILQVGGHRNGANFSPTLLTETDTQMPVFQEETFGPLASVFIAKDETHMIELANQSRYGLGATLFSEDRERAERIAREIESGSVFINSMVRSDAQLPFGGVKKSGYGRELAGFGIRELVNVKTLVIE
ncbi:NAD-dependent succinate-semialdehyde dehydrogenase [Cytophagaceae bacterium YF14B1]|uniref:NAD-dependent succinate-semialdehyde dehydrogenase n=1 Tax=Xanthocytophaga flava TaxID=3048013 RepID=A0AAE3U4Y3_9BACT|nr:NAD-dependent succinate-semialdehyde dehydrogenase [Xanthocytophaga flavus]MDJ1478967.1 NAD-dependent succinate-semialdehyde dehydrogenase [Xanthocytophaga flavus]